ncbi:FAD-dependent monooxygenase [Arthrobacter sp. 260]|uniref:FAD-dependent monooxygenase n=1 Tax=Arthrobacter sp. 260 TaxID=2735314 RepID=UPI00149162F1|nr:FAD-dependent oxidoreductase [Arthrobacter sp. 260]
MRVIVIGGGIGGLALAQGLMRYGLDVIVVERDQDLADTGGYKLHLGEPSIDALRKLLVPESVELLHGSAVGTLGFSLAVRDHRGRLLIRADDGSGGLSLDVDRVTLRLVLAEGLGARLLTGRSCLKWSAEEDSVRVELDNGQSLTGDLLVLADGPNSRLVRQLATRPTTFPTGLVGVAGRTQWKDLSPASRKLLERWPMLAIGPGGTGLFATAHDPVGRPALRARRNLAASREPLAIWGLMTVEGTIPLRPDPSAPVDLSGAAADLLRQRGWTAAAVDIVRHSVKDSVGAFRLYGSDPDRLAPWPASRVTALGDAVHAMPPTGGQGAATAILDAAALADRLGAAARGGTTTVMAIHDYEAAMRGYAAEAVRESLQPVRWILGTASPAGSQLTRLALPAVAAAARLGRVVRPYRREGRKKLADRRNNFSGVR